MRGIRWVAAGFALGALIAFVVSLLRPHRRYPQTGYLAPTPTTRRQVVTRGTPI